MSVKLKRAAPRSTKVSTQIDFGKLSNPEVKSKYLIEVKNKYECLSLESDEQNEESIPKVEKQQKCLKESILHANEEAAPKLERIPKQKSMNDQLLTKMEE